MTNDQHGRLLEQLVRLDEQARSGLTSLRQLHMQLEQINGELAVMNRAIDAMQTAAMPETAVILRGLVSRGTITKAEAERAQAGEVTK